MISSPEIPIDGLESPEDSKDINDPGEAKKTERDPVLVQIDFIFQQMAIVGANSNEHSKIEGIKELYQRGEISGGKAIDMARSLLDSKNSDE